MKKQLFILGTLLLLIIASSCSKDDNDSNASNTETNRPVWVSEITEPGQYENYRTEYDYKRINNKVYLSGLTCYKNNSQLLNCKFTYDSQNRLTEVRSFLPNGDILRDDDYTFDMEIFECIGLNTTISYTDNQAIVRYNGYTYTYSLNSDGYATKFEYIDENELIIEEYKWSNHNITEITHKNETRLPIIETIEYDNKNSIDYIYKLLPFICSKNNLINESWSDDDEQVSNDRGMEYNEYGYPTKITWYDEYAAFPEYIKYIDAKDIK